jgi:hypothetical protein
MLKLVHRTAAVAALGLIGLFFSATIVTESLAGPGQVAWVKQLIVTPGLWLLIPSLAAAGISGNLLARGRSVPTILAKRRRTALAAGNGLLVLVPCALVLARWATMGAMDGAFYLVQGIELLAGAANLTLLGLNLRDGLRLTRSRAPALAV